ncbi:MAG TPA: BON domain-containing protein, partial [Burkholderiales bacterium]|nr:BON domain-containing protein [Burkholderiales bacterium]
VRVCRPLEQRVAWLMHELDTDDEEFAGREIERSDSAKAASIRERFGATWGDPLLFDIVINTGRVSVESGAQQIIQLVSRPEFQETAQSRAMLGDLALEAKVRAALKATPETEDISITFKADGGRVSLLGIVLDDEERNTIGQIVAAIDGVTEVDNQLTLMKRSGLFTSAKW